MRLDELFKNLGSIAGTIGAQMRDAVEGVPLEEIDLTGPPPREVTLSGPARVVLSEGDVFRIDVDAGSTGEEVRFALNGERLRIAGGDSDSVVHISLPTPSKLAVAGSGRMTAARLARDGE